MQSIAELLDNYIKSTVAGLLEFDPYNKRKLMKRGDDVQVYDVNGYIP